MGENSLDVYDKKVALLYCKLFLSRVKAALFFPSKNSRKLDKTFPVDSILYIETFFFIISELFCVLSAERSLFIHEK